MSIQHFDTVTKTRDQDTWNELDTDNSTEQDRVEYAEKVNLLPLHLFGHGVTNMPLFHAKSNFFHVELMIDALDQDSKVRISLQKRQLLKPGENEWTNVQSDCDKRVFTRLTIKPQWQLRGAEKLSIRHLTTERDEIIIRGPVSSETRTVFAVKLDCSVERQGMRNDLVPLFRFISQSEDSQGNVLNVTYGREFFLLNRSTKQEYALRMAKALESFFPSIPLSEISFFDIYESVTLSDDAENEVCGKRSREAAFGYTEEEMLPYTKEARFDFLLDL